MPIITTHCSRIAQAIDTLLTAAAWCGFLYLLNREISLLFATGPGSPGTSAAHMALITQTLFIYLAIAVFNALLLVLWARHHKILFRNLGHRGWIPKLDDETLASSFSLSCQQLRQMQASRMAVIHHTAEGDIAGLEIQNWRPQMASNSDVFQGTRLA
jgi:biofilm PGA synthesis protein PgaD